MLEPARPKKVGLGERFARICLHLLPLALVYAGLGVLVGLAKSNIVELVGLVAVAIAGLIPWLRKRYGCLLPGLVAMMAFAGGGTVYESQVHTGSGPPPPPGRASLPLTINQVTEKMSFDQAHKVLAKQQLTGEPQRFELISYSSSLGAVGLVVDNGKVSDLFFRSSESAEQNRKMFPKSEFVGQSTTVADKLVRDRLNSPRVKGMRPDQGRTAHLYGERWVFPISEGLVTIDRLGPVTLEGTSVYQGHYRVLGLGESFTDDARARFRRGANSYSYETGDTRVYVLVDEQDRATRISNSNAERWDD